MIRALSYTVLFVGFCVGWFGMSRIIVHQQNAAKAALEKRCPHTPLVASTCIRDGRIEVMYPGQKADIAVPVDALAP